LKKTLQIVRGNDGGQKLDKNDSEGTKKKEWGVSKTNADEKTT